MKCERTDCVSWLKLDNASSIWEVASWCLSCKWGKFTSPLVQDEDNYEEYVEE